jgi:hypothetical protein
MPSHVTFFKEIGQYRLLEADSVLADSESKRKDHVGLINQSIFKRKFSSVIDPFALNVRRPSQIQWR